MHSWMGQNKLILIFVLSFLLVYTGFIRFMHTPWYAASQIKFGYQSRNTALMVRNIDIPSIVFNGYDDVTGDLFVTKNNMPANVRQIFNQFYQLIKHIVCDGTLEMIDGYLTDNIWKNPTGASVLKGRELGIDYDELLERSMIRNTAVRKVGRLTRDSDGNYLLPVTVYDRYTNMDFELQVLLEKNDEGMWAVTKIMNYHEYLVQVREFCNVDIASYIENTKDKTADYNRRFQFLQGQFQAVTKDIGSDISKNKKKQIKSFILDSIIPAYKSREEYLQNVNVPPGAFHLHILRLQSNAKTIEAWQTFAKGVEENSAADLTKAERNHQAALVLEQKVSDIINKMPALFVPEIP